MWSVPSQWLISKLRQSPPALQPAPSRSDGSRGLSHPKIPPVLRTCLLTELLMLLVKTDSTLSVLCSLRCGTLAPASPEPRHMEVAGRREWAADHRSLATHSRESAGDTRSGLLLPDQQTSAPACSYTFGLLHELLTIFNFYFLHLQQTPEMLRWRLRFHHHEAV
jgi:hypothetical protein